MDELMTQVYQNYNPFNLDTSLFKVMIVIIGDQLTMGPATSRTH